MWEHICLAQVKETEKPRRGMQYMLVNTCKGSLQKHIFFLVFKVVAETASLGPKQEELGLICPLHASLSMLFSSPSGL